MDLEREVIFGTVGFVFMMAAPKLPLLIVVVLVAFADLLELLQNMSPSRHGSIDAIGVVLGAITNWLVDREP